MFRVIIPARYASQRLPGKPLLDIGGKPMVQHVYECALKSDAASVVVATDDGRIEEVVRAFGGQVVMTAATHHTGTDRVAEAAAALGYADEDIVVNLQGDEPMMPATLVQQVAASLAAATRAEVSTLCHPVHTAAELFDPNVVKVVMDNRGDALYFSRAPIPWDRDAFAERPDKLPAGAEYYRHLGIYAYRVSFLRHYVELDSCPLEELEALEQLRILWHGYRICIARALEMPGDGIDTAADLERVRAQIADY